MIAQILFILLLGVASFFAYKRFAFVKRNILLGRDLQLEGSSGERWSTMARVALGQGKMFTRPIAAVMHLIIYAGFIIINIELLEIVLDGITGHHRLFSFLGSFYNFLIGSFEILALLVLVACVVFLARRNVMRIKRFWMREMTSWPRTDANLILIAEVFLMSAFLTMNACDAILQARGLDHYVTAGSFPVSQLIMPMLESSSDGSLIFIERFCWWFHIIGILAFIVYVTYSKHLHIILAFPNTFFSKLHSAGELSNLQSVTNE
ncbi:MAG: Fe-S oxidoreductase, partial [Flavobacteriales bacterium]